MTTSFEQLYRAGARLNFDDAVDLALWVMA